MIEFSQLSDNARIWVYTTDRFIKINEKDIMLILGQAFINSWSAHGDKLKASIKVLNNCFLVIAVDEKITSASGCSIDASITFLQNLETELQISLLDWQNMAYSQNGKINLIKRTDFEIALKENKISSDISVYNTNAKTKLEFLNNKTSPLAETNFHNIVTM